MNMTEALGLFHALQSIRIITQNSTLSALAARCESQLREFLMENIREGFLKCKLSIVSFIAGMQDAATLSDYTCFAYNQIISTLFLAIGVTGFINNAYSF